jgi:hypothetical protein
MLEFDARKHRQATKGRIEQRERTRLIIRVGAESDTPLLFIVSGFHLKCRGYCKTPFFFNYAIRQLERNCSEKIQIQNNSRIKSVLVRESTVKDLEERETSVEHAHDDPHMY